MKVILLQDVRGIGRRYEIKDIPNGHALNFLIPRKMAEPATPLKIRQVHERTKRLAEDAIHAEERFKEAVKKLESLKVELKAQSNEKGSLFESVKPEDIQKALEDAGITVSAKHIILDSPIKEVGEHIVTLRSGEATGAFTVIVKN